MDDALFNGFDEIVRRWDRIPSADDAHAGLTEAVQSKDLSVLLLGAAQDGTPLLAFGDPADERPRLLLIGGGAGDSVLSIAVTAHLLAQRRELLAGWNVWAICAADPASARLNDGTLGQLRPKAADHALQRRLAWGPGEDPERNLPVDHDRLYQPQARIDGLPEDWVPSSPESVALARAIAHLKPDLTVSLREVPAGGVTIGSSQELADDDYRRLVEAIASDRLFVFAAGKQREGRQVHGQNGLLVLPSIEEELARAASSDADEQARLIGGVGTWQALNAADPDALYLTVDVPRFTAAALNDEGESDQVRDVVVEIENRERKSAPVPFRVIRLHRPGHPAHEQELRVEPAKGEGFAEGRHEAVPAAAGWLAVEAHLERRQVLRDALAEFERCLPQLEHQDHLRSMQLLRAMAEGQDSLLVGYQSNKRYGRRATVAEAFYWASVFPFMTALILAEARRGLERENREDREVKATLAKVDELLDSQLQGAAALTATPVAEAAGLMARFAAAAAEIGAAGGPALLLATQRRDRAQKTFAEKRKRARHVRQLKLPKPERALADRELADAEADLERCEAALAALTQAPHEEQPEQAATPEPATAEAAVDAAAEQEQPQPAAGAVEPASRPEPEPVREQDSDAQPVSPAPEPAKEITVEDVPDETVQAPPHEVPVEPPAPDLAGNAAEELAIPAEPAAEPEELVVDESASPEQDADEEPPAADPQDQRSEEELGAELQALMGQLESDQGEQPAPETGQAPQAIDSVEDAPAAQETPQTDSQEERPGPGELDVEMLLPKHLPLPAEWGRGPMVWEHQLPDREDPPPFRRMLKELIDEHSGEDAPAGELTQQFSEAEDDSSVELEPAQPAQNIGDLRGSTVGFRRSRVDLRGRPPELVPRLKAVAGTGGRFERRRRRIPIS